MQYRRARLNGATYFFTVVTGNRNPIFADDNNVRLLGQSFRRVRSGHPFEIDAMVLLPDHIHAIWTLPPGDSDYSARWRLIKSGFSRNLAKSTAEAVTASRQKKRERGVWQRRFWEHLVRDEEDYRRHIEYIHYNPVRHGFVRSPREWRHSSFDRYVREGIYPADWGSGPVDLAPDIGRE